MKYNDAIEYIHGTRKLGSKLGLNNIKTLLDLMYNPHKGLNFVHVAGTNGKGSTVTFISSILAAAGYRVGIFTSPYINRFSERIKINDDEISKDDIARITTSLSKYINQMVDNGCNHPTEFEMVTAMAFQYFWENHCDIVVLEVGLGGRLDSTNIIDCPEVAVITTIHYDHTEFLGSTLAEIAYEKAGIIKEKCDVVLYPQQRAIESLFEQICHGKEANLHKVPLSNFSPQPVDLGIQEFDFDRYKNLKISMLGSHQIQNATVAVKTVEVLKVKGYEIAETAIRRGLLHARWPGRLEIVNQSPLVLIDGAHNIQGVTILKKNLMRYFPDKRITFILGVLADKDYKAMIDAVTPLASRFITITPNNDRALNSSELADFIKPYCQDVWIGENIEKAINLSLDLSSQDDVICAFGSLYYIGEIREYFGLTNSQWGSLLCESF